MTTISHPPLILDGEELTEEQLANAIRKRGRQHTDAMRMAERRRLSRDEAIAVALDAGWPHARIAPLLGVRRNRVGQIALAIKRAATGA